MKTKLERHLELQRSINSDRKQKTNSVNKSKEL